MNSSYSIERPITVLKEHGTYPIEIVRVQTEALFAMHEFLRDAGIQQIMPVILSPVTDPLNHPVYDASIEYMDQKLQLTKSMILHKQVAVAKLDAKGIYVVSPNVRLEKSIGSDKHLLEFSQLDIELKDANADEFMNLMERLMIHIFKRVGRACKRELNVLGSEVKIPRRPFPRYSSGDLREEFGDDFESQMSKLNDSLFWITDYAREFYDREDEENEGHYLNYDLFYPEGFGEALSGGERDYRYDVLLRKIKQRGQDPESFRSYLELAKKGVLGPSAGGGLGIERLVRFLTRRSHIREVTLFPRVPGEYIPI